MGASRHKPNGQNREKMGGRWTPANKQRRNNKRNSSMTRQLWPTQLKNQRSRRPMEFSLPDMVSTVNQPPARRARKSSPQSAVNNRAAPVKNHDQTVLPPGYNSSGGI